MSEDLFLFVSGLLKIDPCTRLSSSDLRQRMGLGVSANSAFSAPPRSLATTGKRGSSPSPLVKPVPAPVSSSLMPPPGKPTYRHSESAPENLSSASPSVVAKAVLDNNNHPSRLSPTPMGSHAPPATTVAQQQPPPPATSAKQQPQQAAPSPQQQQQSQQQQQAARARPGQRHSSARNSLRAQTLLKLESLSVNHYARGRNPGLGPLSPGTPDVGLAKKFFEEDPQVRRRPHGLMSAPSTLYL